MLTKTPSEQQQTIQELLQRLPQGKLAVVYDFLSYLVYREERQMEDASLVDWLRIAEPSFQFWNNERDAAYDNL